MSIQLTKLCHDVVQNSYKDMHALLDSIGDDDIPTRHQRLVEHILTQRHRFARLLVAVRWFMSYSAFHYSAQTTRDLGARRSNVIIHSADTLWAVSGVVRGAAAHSSAVQEAAEVLGAAPYLHRIPRYIESSVGIDTFGNAFETSSDDSSEANAKSPSQMDVDNIASQMDVDSTTKGMNVDNHRDASDEETKCQLSTHLSEVEAEAVARLRAATTDLASRALPSGVKIIKLGVEPAEAAVRVGVPDAWTADVVLDRLLIAEAFFVLLRFNILVDSSPDAVNDMKRGAHASEGALPLTKEQQEPLRQMLDDRMRWAALSVKGGDTVERAKKVLLCLCEAMSYDCCGKLALHHIRAQCHSLVSRGVWSTQDVSVTEPGISRDSVSPIHVRYWQRSSMKDDVAISVSSESSSTNTSASESAHIANVVSVRSMALSNSGGGLLNPASLDVERMLLHICRSRALDFMTNLIQDCTSILPRSAAMKMLHSSTSVMSVMLLLSGESPELIFGISLQTGGVLVRYYGSLARSSAYSSPHVKALKELVWEGERFFSKRDPFLHDVLKGIVEKAVAAYNDVTSKASIPHEKSTKARTAAIPRSPRALSRKVSSVKEVMNDVSVDLGSSLRVFRKKTSGKSDREPPNEFRDRSACALPMNTVTSRTERSLNAGRAASTLARADEAIYSQAFGSLRDMLIQEMQSLKVVTAPPSSTSTRVGKFQIPVKAVPMDAESSTVHIRGCDGWVLRIVLRRNIFDTVAPGGVVSYLRKTRTLRFTYPHTTRRTVHCFRKDLIRARTAAVLIAGLGPNPGRFKVRRRRPTHVTLEIGDITLSAGLGRHAVELETYPPQPIMTAKLIPLLEEILNNAGMEMGQRFGALLDMSVPIGLAIQSIIPEDPTKFKVRFVSALRVRYIVAHAIARKQVTYAIDIDARAGRDRMMLIDVARAHKVTSNSKSSSAAQHFSPLPMWEAVLSKLAAKGKGKPLHNGAAVQIPTSLLPTVLLVTVGKFR